MHLFTRIGDDTSTFLNNRWFVFDFSVSPDGDPCPNLDMDLYSGPPGVLVQPPINSDPCVDNLEVRLRAGVLFKGNTTEQALDIQILGQQAPIYNLVYAQPVFILEDPAHPGDADYRILATRHPVTGEDRSTAELIDNQGTPKKKDDEFVGTYNIGFEIKARRINCEGGCPAAAP